MKAVLVILDGLADRSQAVLNRRTPLQAARTPNLDALAGRGACGHVYPLSPGSCPSSDVAHWHILGYSQYPFCGRTSIEVMGAGYMLEQDEVYFRVNLATTVVDAGKAYARFGPARLPDEKAAELYSALEVFEGRSFGCRLLHLGGPFMALALSGGASALVTDSDPLFPRVPVSPIVPLDGAPPAATATASELERFSEFAADVLREHPVNAERVGEGMDAINSVLIKWPSVPPSVPSFDEKWGFDAGAFAAGVFYAGLAGALGMKHRAPPDRGTIEDFRWCIEGALDFLDEGGEFAFVHTKLADESSHTGRPRLKVDVIEGLDRELAALLEACDTRDDVLFVITADHATPSGGSQEVIHSGESVPLLMAGETVRIDNVDRFDEVSSVAGSLGQLRGCDVMPMVLNATNRARFASSRTDPAPAPYRRTG